MKRTGNCKRCGTCCRDFCIDLHVGGVTDYEFTEYLRWLGAHVGVETSIKDFKNRDIELQIKNPCKYLVDNKDGTFSCGIQGEKPDPCKRYPEEDYGDDISAKCGFQFVP
jgi:Fe-S-cluster containining protein